jgi:hypothetical protein
MTDRLTDYMRENNIPITRENYLDIAFGAERETLTAEEEASLPEEVQLLKPTDKQ